MLLAGGDRATTHTSRRSTLLLMVTVFGSASGQRHSRAIECLIGASIAAAPLVRHSWCALLRWLGRLAAAALVV